MKTKTEIFNRLNNRFGIDKWQFTAKQVDTGNEGSLLMQCDLKLLDYPNEVFEIKSTAGSLKEAELCGLKHCYFFAWQFNAKIEIAPEEEDCLPF